MKVLSDLSQDVAKANEDTSEILNELQVFCFFFSKFKKLFTSYSSQTKVLLPNCDEIINLLIKSSLFQKKVQPFLEHLDEEMTTLEKITRSSLDNSKINEKRVESLLTFHKLQVNLQLNFAAIEHSHLFKKKFHDLLED